MSNNSQWYIVKVEQGKCAIISVEAANKLPETEYWGPFAERAEAIARRVGLIRAGKCKPW